MISVKLSLNAQIALDSLVEEDGCHFIKRNTIINAAVLALRDLEPEERKEFYSKIKRGDRRLYYNRKKYY